MTYYRLKGPGDFDHPVELEREDMYAEHDAEGDVANTLIEDGDVHELVTDVRRSLRALTAVQHDGRFNVACLLNWAARLDRMVDAQVELMSNKGED